MNSTLQQLETEASQLPSDQRAELALRLLQSLEPIEDGEIQESWRLEADRRLAEIESDDVKTVPGDEVLSRVRRRLG